LQHRVSELIAVVTESRTKEVLIIKMSHAILQKEQGSEGSKDICSCFVIGARFLISDVRSVKIIFS
jgi:hypothetical protein